MFLISPEVLRDKLLFKWAVQGSKHMEERQPERCSACVIAPVTKAGREGTKAVTSWPPLHTRAWQLEFEDIRFLPF